MTGPQPPYDGQGGQWHAGGDWQAPSDQSGYSGPPGHPQPQDHQQYGYDQQPGYDQYGPPQQYDQYQQPGYPDQYSVPPGGYAEPYPAAPGYPGPHPVAGVPPPPAKQSNPVPVILGILAGVVVLVLVVIVGAWFLLRDTGGGSPTAGGSSSDRATGKYSAAKLGNACDLVDPAVLEKWGGSPKGEPEHTENKTEYYSSFTCSARYQGRGDDYSSASLNLYASISDQAKDSYARAEKSAKGRSGTGRENGDVSGLGEDAFFNSWEKHSDYTSAVTYEIGVLDGNLTFTLHISAFGDKGAVDKAEVAKAAEDQARKVMEEFAG